MKSRVGAETVPRLAVNAVRRRGSFVESTGCPCTVGIAHGPAKTRRANVLQKNLFGAEMSEGISIAVDVKL